MRDQIYSYLLVAEHVETPPHVSDSQDTSDDEALRSAAHGYYFVTNVMRVSKQTHRETAAMLYGANTFVIVSTKCFAFEDIRNILDVPIVSDHHAGYLQHHSLRLHLTCNKAPVFERPSPASSLSNGCGLQSYVMLAQDLPILGRLLSFFCNLLPHAAICVLRDHQDTRFETELPKRPVKTSLLVALHNTQYKTLSERMHEELLAPLHRVISSCLRVKISGTTCDRIRELEHFMMPQLIWPAAVLWQLYDTAKCFKKSVDDLVAKGKILPAIVRYEWILNAGSNAASGLFPRSFVCEDIQASRAMYYLKHLFADVAASLTWIRIRLDGYCDNPEGLRDTAQYLSLIHI